MCASDISPENRQQLDRLLDARFAELLRAIGAGRGQTPDQVRAAIDRAPLSARAALDAGLVDALCYEDELDQRLKSGDREPIILDWDEAEQALRLQPLRFHRKLVGVVAVEGTIASGSSRNLPLPIPLIGGQQAGADSISQALRQAERNRRIAAVVLYVNSPGGDAFASDLIWREVLRLGKKKPVVVAMGDAAASGGYYIAAPAAAIVAQPGSVTGSIGVVLLRPIAAGLFERAGINTVVLSRGAHSGLLRSPTRRARRSAGAARPDLHLLCRVQTARAGGARDRRGAARVDRRRAGLAWARGAGARADRQAGRPAHGAAARSGAGRATTEPQRAPAAATRQA